MGGYCLSSLLEFGCGAVVSPLSVRLVSSPYAAVPSARIPAATRAQLESSFTVASFRAAGGRVVWGTSRRVQPECCSHHQLAIEACRRKQLGTPRGQAVAGVCQDAARSAFSLAPSGTRSSERAHRRTCSGPQNRRASYDGAPATTMR